MRRLNDERGAVAVVVALVMVPLIGFAAISLDVAGMWFEKQQLQTGADAGALAIAQACAKGSCTTSTQTPAQAAQSLATANQGSASVTATVPSLTTSQVTVRTDATQRHVFAPILGVNSTALHAQSTVAWGSPSGGTAVLPLAFSWCEWKAQAGESMPSGATPSTIYFPKTSGTGCTGPSSNFTPGGFAWLQTSGACSLKSAVDDELQVDPGISAPSSCTDSYIASLQNKIVLLPLFDRATGTGSGAFYHVYGYAAFVLTGYNLGGQFKLNAPCSGNDRCIRGSFTRFVSLDEAFTYSATAPQLGVAVLRLLS